MLFDASALRLPLPENVLVFASGANRVAEILGFVKVGIPVGVSVCELNDQAIGTLIATGNPVLIDSGAFSEVVFSEDGLQVVSEITNQEWRRRLSVYLRLARGLRDKALLVAPDRVGDQRVTLDRLARYRVELAEIAETGAELLVPLQIGELNHAEFYRAAIHAAGVTLIPALPLKKAATSATEMAEFVATVQPPRLHLLGMGAENARSTKLIRLIRLYSPNTRISMDSNRIRAVTGRTRRMTLTEARLRAEEVESIYGEVLSESLALSGVILDYTDEIASPSGWATEAQLHAIAILAGLDILETNSLLTDPDGFLQSFVRTNECLTWIEHPVVWYALDRAWEEFVYQTVRTSVRTASIVHTFEGSIISGQVADRALPPLLRLQDTEETMTDPNQYNIPTDSISRDAMLAAARFERFTDSELAILGDALRELLQVKTEALQIVNADLGSNPESVFTEQDFGIPAIEAMLTEIEALS